MEHCPVCQASLRSGVRFCPTCGYRLPEPATEQAAPVEDAAPTSWPTDRRWLAADGAEVDAGEPDRDDADDLEWRAAPDRDPDSADGSDADAPAPDDTVVAWGTVPTAPVFDDPASDPEDVDPDAIVDPAGGPEALAIAEPTPHGDDDAATAVAPVAVAVAGRDEDHPSALERAESLLDELRALLPHLAHPGATTEWIAADLVAAASAPPERWADLRATMEQARDNPRDVETVLALARRVDDVLALIDAYDRLATASRAAADGLRERPADS